MVSVQRKEFYNNQQQQRLNQLLYRNGQCVLPQGGVLEQPQGAFRGLTPLDDLELFLPPTWEGTTKPQTGQGAEIPQTGDATQPRDQGTLPPTDEATPLLSGNDANVFYGQTMAKDDEDDLPPECVSNFIELKLLAG